MGNLTDWCNRRSSFLTTNHSDHSSVFLVVIWQECGFLRAIKSDRFKENIPVRERNLSSLHKRLVFAWPRSTVVLKFYNFSYRENWVSRRINQIHSEREVNAEAKRDIFMVNIVGVNHKCILPQQLNKNGDKQSGRVKQCNKLLGSKDETVGGWSQINLIKRYRRNVSDRRMKANRSMTGRKKDECLTKIVSSNDNEEPSRVLLSWAQQSSIRSTFVDKLLSIAHI